MPLASRVRPSRARRPDTSSVTGMQLQNRLRSPYTLSTRATGGQYFDASCATLGQAASRRGYACDQSSADTAAAVCGACLSGLSARSMRPASIARISSRIAIIASTKRSSSAFDSLSVGSIISVPATGKLIVGAWKP